MCFVGRRLQKMCDRKLKGIRERRPLLLPGIRLSTTRLGPLGHRGHLDPLGCRILSESDAGGLSL